jgi:hypothetical protein
LPHDIVTAQMSPAQRNTMYDLASRLADVVNTHAASSDIRLVSIALLRVQAACLARSEWGRDKKTVDDLTALFPLYCAAAVQSNDGSRIIRPFTKLP